MLGPKHRKTLSQLSPGNLYLVGGSVRDMLMDRETTDTDITVVGDACELARKFAKATGGQCTIHERFGTATVRTNGESIDLITARSEAYPAPGTLPKVRPGTLKDDLARRDFSINAMAMSLDGNTLIDHHNGRADLTQQVVRTLHPKSFQDDPTRILRAVRYEQRLGFRITEPTQSQLMCALKNQALDNVSGDRVRHEMERAIQEKHALSIFRRMAELGVFRAIHTSWNPDFRHIPEDWNPEPIGWMVASTWQCEQDTLESIIGRLSMPREWSRTLQAGSKLQTALQQITGESTPSDVCEILNPLAKMLEIMDTGRLAPEAAGAISRYLSEWRDLRPELDGRDLIQIGVPEGPERGQLMRNLRKLRLNNPNATREDEETLVRQFLADQSSL